MIYLEEEIYTHRKMVLAGSLVGRRGGLLAALGLYTAGLGYARKHLTDGFIDDAFLDNFPTETCAKDVAKALSSARVRLWHRVRGGYQIHDYEDHNVPAETLKKKRADARERKRRQRAKSPVAAPLLPGVTHHVTRDTECDPVRTRGTTTTTTKNERTTDDGVPSVPSNASTASGSKEPAGAVLAFRRARSKGTDGAGQPKVDVLAALARSVIQANPDEADEGELLELVKRAAARANLAYDSRSVEQALFNAAAVLGHMRRRGAVR